MIADQQAYFEWRGLEKQSDSAADRAMVGRNKNMHDIPQGSSKSAFIPDDIPNTHCRPAATQMTAPASTPLDLLHIP